MMDAWPTMNANPPLSGSCRGPCRRPRAIREAPPPPNSLRRRPGADWKIAQDPEIRPESAPLPGESAAVAGSPRADGYVDGDLTASTADTHYPWPLQRGTHSVK